MKTNKKVILEPGPGKVVVKVTKADDDRYGEGYIIIPDTIREPRTVGEIVAVYEPFVDPADGEETVAFFRVGDEVVFGKHSGADITIEREKYIVLRESEILVRFRIETEEDFLATASDQLHQMAEGYYPRRHPDAND